MGHLDVAHLSHALPDGRGLFHDVSFRVGDATVAALVGPNGAGKTTLLRLLALQDGLDAFAGTVLAVTHDRWSARSFDRFLVFGADGSVHESDEPVWDETRPHPTPRERV